MTELLEKAIVTVRQLAPEQQDEIARLLLSIAGAGEEPGEIDPEHLPHVLEGLAQAERGEFVSDEAMQATFARFLHP
jgi:hypothetical protein